MRRAVFAAALLAALAGSAAEARAWSAHGSVHQVYAVGLPGHARVALYSSHGKRLQLKTADAQGGVLFRNVKPGKGYRLRTQHGDRSGPLTVMTLRSAPPSTSVYGQSIPSSGYHYLTTRDGTKLAIDVHPPQDVASSSKVKIPLLASVPTGPTPTLIEYSGYGYADPAGPQNGIAVLANLMGFTVVDVNMRGTGCSGGAYDFFEPLQNLDGYDVVETIAGQPWVKGHKVGMMGISYGGISQLFTAQTRPPSLAAISPLSVIDSTQTTLYPGGILNTGFALHWAKERIHDAKPASAKGGQPWAYKRIRGGDRTCASNQSLHGEAVNLLAKIKANRHYVPKVADPLAPITFVKKIRTPTFLACQWTDEQTGGHCPTLAEHFSGTRRKWFTFTNGTHVDSLDPQTFNRWYDFLELYVAHEAPITKSAVIHAAGPLIYQQAMGITGVTMPDDPVQHQPTYAGALAAFQALPPIRILFDNGAGGSSPGQPQPAYEHSFPRFPVPGTRARSWWFAGGGTLAAKPPKRGGANAFTWNARSTPLTDFTGPQDGSSGGIWTAKPPYKWARHPSGTAVSYATAPLPTNTTVIGAGAVRLWVRASRPDVDLQATVTEIRPDGKEVFVQGGWVRGNERKLDARKSTLLEPWLSLRARDVRSLSRTRWAKVVIPLYYEGHAYRKGSRIRVTISAPNGDQPIWAFSQPAPSLNTKATVTIAAGHQHASRLVVPVVPGLSVPTGLPPCPGLRGEPCRAYKAVKNRNGAAGLPHFTG